MSVMPAEPPAPADLPDRDAVRELGRVDEDLGLAVGRRVAAVRVDPAVRDVPVLRDAVRDVPEVRDVAVPAVPDVRERAVVVRRAGADAVGFAVDIVFAAAVRAFAAVVMALVAVFIARMAEDIVLADAVALVAAAVILLAADVTLVAAVDTVFAAVAGVVEPPRAAVVLRPAVVVRRVVLRPPAVLAPVLRVAELRVVVPLRAAVEREPVERDAVDRDAELRVVREVVLRADVPLAAGFAAVLRVARDEVLDDLELDVDGRLAVPLDALRLTDLLRAVLAEPRRVAARVLD